MSERVGPRGPARSGSSVMTACVAVALGVWMAAAGGCVPRAAAPPARLPVALLAETSEAAAEPWQPSVDPAVWLARAEAHAPGVRAAEAELAAARAEASAAGLSTWEAPELRIQNIEPGRFAAGDGGLTMSVRAEFPRPGVLASRVDAAGWRVEAARAGLEGARALARGEACRALLTARSDSQRQALWRARVALLDTRLGAARGQVEAGHRPARALRVLGQTQLEAAHQAAGAAADARLGRAELGLALGLGPAALAPASVELATAATAWRGWADAAARASPTEVATAAVAESPARVEAAATVAEARAAAAEAEALRWPWVRFVEIGYRLSADPQDEPRDGRGVGGGFAIELPIFAASGEAQEAAEARAMAALARHDALSEALALDAVRAQQALAAALAWEAELLGVEAMVGPAASDAGGLEARRLAEADEDLAHRRAAARLEASRAVLDAALTLAEVMGSPAAPCGDAGTPW